MRNVSPRAGIHPGQCGQVRDRQRVLGSMYHGLNCTSNKRSQ